MKRVSKRSAFVIGRDGVVTYDWVSDNPAEQPDYADVRRALAAAP
jgi:peroxiredoxin